MISIFKLKSVHGRPTGTPRSPVSVSRRCNAISGPRGPAFCPAAQFLKPMLVPASINLIPTRGMASYRSHSRYLSARENNYKSDERGYYYDSQPPPRTRRYRLLEFLLYLLGGGLFVSGVFSAVDFFVNPPTEKEKERQTVVVVGGGWGGLACVKEIDSNRFDVVLVSPSDQFVFTPLLNQVALGELPPTSISEPVRQFLQRFNPDVTFHEAYCTDVDPVKQVIKCKDVTGTNQFEVKYDKLILSVGGQPNTFNIKGVKENCLFLKEIQDTTAIRKKIVDCFEQAALPNQTEENIKKLLHFVVVGGGPHSIQFTGGLHDLVNKEMIKMYPSLAGKATITLVDNFDPKNTYDHKIHNYFKANVLDPIKENLDVKQVKVKEVLKDQVLYEDKSKEGFGACIWLTANAPSPLLNSLRKTKSKSKGKKTPAEDEQVNLNALTTNQYLQVKGYGNIYAIGECGTVAQNFMQKKWMEIFDFLDDNKDGFIQPDEFKALVPYYGRQYPQLLEYAKKAESMFEEADVNKDGKLTKEEFQAIVKKIDRNVTSYPTTAQTAQQQGKYLAHALNHTLHERDIRKIFKELDEDKSGSLDSKELRKGLRRLGLPVSKKEVTEMIASSDANKDNLIDEEEFVKFALDHQQSTGVGDWKKLSHMRILPFRYKHLGGYEYVGYEEKITFRGSPGTKILDGFGAWWLWESVLLSKLVSNRQRVETLLNYSSFLYFGRNISKY